MKFEEGQEVELAVVFLGRGDGEDCCIYDSFKAVVENHYYSGSDVTEMVFKFLDRSHFSFHMINIEELGNVIKHDDDVLIVFCLNNMESIIKAQRDLSKAYKDMIESLQEEVMMWEDMLHTIVKDFPKQRKC